MHRNTILAWGARGPEFKSRRPDQFLSLVNQTFVFIGRSGKNPPTSLTGTATGTKLPAQTLYGARSRSVTFATLCCLTSRVSRA